MKPRLLILSDLFGGKNPEWVNYYVEKLQSKFDIQYYDVLKLGNIDASDFSEKTIHNQFLNEGIGKAVETLVKLEKDKVVVLGFSIGGTIAWKAALSGMNICHLFAISSTRLRYETESPNCIIKLYFGENDLNKPNIDWFLNFKIENIILKNQEHQLYFEQENIDLICNEFLKA